MKFLAVVLTQEACAVLVAHFHSSLRTCACPSTKVSHEQQYDYYRSYAIKKGWDSITQFYPRRTVDVYDFKQLTHF